MRIFIVLIIIVSLAIVSLAIGGFAFAEGIEDRFQNKEKLVYDVYFNGISSGYIEWEYLGRKDVDGIAVDVLSVNSDTNILNLLDLDSEEKVFINSKTFLPIRVERDIVFFGKKEIIKEVYDQEKGQIRITQSSSKEEENILTQDTPIHNILELLYFFPQDLALVTGKWMTFNLPTQKIKIKMVKERVLKVNDLKKDTY